MGGSYGRDTVVWIRRKSLTFGCFKLLAIQFVKRKKNHSSSSTTMTSLMTTSLTLTFETHRCHFSVNFFRMDILKEITVCGHSSQSNPQVQVKVLLCKEGAIREHDLETLPSSRVVEQCMLWSRWHVFQGMPCVFQQDYDTEKCCHKSMSLY